ncbi:MULTISPECIES: hypothetical protein [unclassified Brevundimonas]|uniref:hypothetical protein n=1 Tax=unclassified Brevundimonas TaxID=2622653 RepID=UPI002004138A|nr:MULTISPECIES: hypothetical protein [unclassified Brevundimonas]MCK6104779.1 hypothetical protein [Brevundimonas sp. EYE_349]
MAAKTKLLTPKGLLAVTLLAAAIVVLIGFIAWPPLSAAIAQDSCLDSGDAWNGQTCVGARLR